MSPKLDTTSYVLSRWFVRLLVAAAVCYVAWRTREIIVLVLLSAVLAAALTPLVDFLCRRRIRLLHPKSQRLLVSVLVFIMFLVICGATLGWLVAPVGHEFKRLSDYSTFTKAQINAFADSLQSLYNGLPPLAKDLLPKSGSLNERIEGIVAIIFAEAKTWLGHIWEIFVIPVLAFYFVVDSGSLKKQFVSLFRREKRREVIYVLNASARIFRSYIVGQVVLCLIAGAVMAPLLIIWKVKYAATLAALAAITRAVPIIGPIFSGALIFLVIVASNSQLALTVLAIFCTLHFVESKIVMPVLLGDLMRLHPALLLISILVGYEFFGIMGMFMAAPVSAICRNIINRYYIDKRDRIHLNPSVELTPASGPDEVRRETSDAAVA